MKFPIDTLKNSFIQHWGQVPLVISAPTASGKSTQIPRWCRQQAMHQKNKIKILVIEPRRVACRSLAQYVAQLEESTLGDQVGYQVRDESCVCAQSQIIFVTPGIALHLWKKDRFQSYQAVIIDEFHERTLSLDLLLSLCIKYPPYQLIVMSATFSAQSICDFMGAKHLQGEGRQYQVHMHYRPGQQQEAYRHDLVTRVSQTTWEAFDQHDGDILVFLPGKGEIAACKEQLTYEVRQRKTHRASHTDQNPNSIEILPLHASLSLQQQNQVFTPVQHRRIILATNVAETSVTVPHITIVIDSGLVRQSRHQHGRSVLELTTIAQDSADQRAGRAGRLQVGHCYRLWGQGVRLTAYSKPEIHRESLLPLILSALACEVHPQELSWLDAPYPKAMQEAYDLLQQLGAIQDQKNLSSIGALLFELGIEALWGRWLIQAQKNDCLVDMIDLLSALLCKQRILLPMQPHNFYLDPIRRSLCDATALIKAMRIAPQECNTYAINPVAFYEAQKHRTRLYQCFDFALSHANLHIDLETPIHRQKLIRTLLQVDQHSVYVARQRKKHWAWCSVGQDIEWSTHSLSWQAVQADLLDRPDALLVLDHHSVQHNKRRQSMATSVLTITLHDIKKAQLGEKKVVGGVMEQGVLWATVHHMFARKLLATDTTHIQGKQAQIALIDVIMKKQLWPSLMKVLPLKLHHHNLYIQHRNLYRNKQIGQIHSSQKSFHYLNHLPLDTQDDRTYTQFMEAQGEKEQIYAWFMDQLDYVGFEDTQDLTLLEQEDLIPVLDEDMIKQFDKDFPYILKLSDAHYHCTYDVAKRRCIMVQVAGKRKNLPPVQQLPRCQGFEIRLKKGQHNTVVRPKRTL